jgi:WXXGXW repeat (2 copies)
MRSQRALQIVLIALTMLAIPAASQAQIAVGVSVHIGPPALPVYVQPPCPAPGYIWTPGYWAYGPDGYYWVPGTWVVAPAVGLLWTPGYWGWGGGAYLWHAGYWGPHVGFYGGINYGFGYGGVGFVGGEWRGGVFNYNRSVTNVNVTVIHNTYNRTVINNNTTVNNTTINRTSFNGGTGGTTAQPTAAEQAAAREQHVQPTSTQLEHEHTASTNRAQFASVNHGQPSVAASPKPGVFSGRNVMAAKAANTNRPSSPNKPATASNVRSNRPPNASSQSAAFKSNTTTSNNANHSKPVQSAPHSSGRPPQQPHTSAPSGGNKPEHGRPEGKPGHR